VSKSEPKVTVPPTVAEEGKPIDELSKSKPQKTDDFIPGSSASVGTGTGTSKEPVFDENTVHDIIFGLTATINRRTWSKADQTGDLIPEDYKLSYQFKLPRKNCPLLKIKDFAPKVFYHIRKHFGFSGTEYLRSFTFDNMTAIKGEGKSGAFFYFYER